MAFENGVVLEDWSSAVIVPLYKGIGERAECKKYRGISLLSMVGEIYAGILVDRVHRAMGFYSREGVCRSNLHIKAGR